MRLAGVYAIARLADDWDEQRQVCIDVLCAYLRMPYEPDTASEKHREGEVEVRPTIIRIIRDHLQDPTAPTTWCSRDLDLTAATFDGGDFGGVRFIGGKVSFVGTKFTGGTVSFVSAEFNDSAVEVYKTEITDSDIAFFGARFTDGKLSFLGANFTGGEAVSLISFFDAEFTGGEVSFVGAKFVDSSITWGPFEPPDSLD